MELIKCPMNIKISANASVSEPIYGRSSFDIGDDALKKLTREESLRHIKGMADPNTIRLYSRVGYMERYGKEPDDMYRVKTKSAGILSGKPIIDTKEMKSPEGRKIIDTVAIEKIRGRSINPEKYKTTAQYDYVNLSDDEANRFKSKGKPDKQMGQELKGIYDDKSRVIRRYSYRQRKPWIFGRKKFNEAAKNPIQHRIFIDSKSSGIAGERFRSLSKKNTFRKVDEPGSKVKVVV